MAQTFNNGEQLGSIRTVLNDNADEINTLQASKASIASLASGSGSSLIGYNEGGVGSVTRTVQSRLRESLSVEDFGAVGNGSTDDTVAIQAAIDAAVAGGSLRVHIPAGEYKITDTITIDQSLSLYIYGDGERTTELRFYNAVADKVFFDATAASSNTHFEDLHFVDNTAGTSTCFRAQDDLPDTDGFSHYKDSFERCRVSSFKTGILITTSDPASGATHAFCSEPLFLHSRFKNNRTAFRVQNLQAVDITLVATDIENDDAGESYTFIRDDVGATFNIYGGSFVGKGVFYDCYQAGGSTSLWQAAKLSVTDARFELRSPHNGTVLKPVASAFATNGTINLDRCLFLNSTQTLTLVNFGGKTAITTRDCKVTSGTLKVIQSPTTGITSSFVSADGYYNSFGSVDISGCYGVVYEKATSSPYGAYDERYTAPTVVKNAMSDPAGSYTIDANGFMTFKSNDFFQRGAGLGPAETKRLVYNLDRPLSSFGSVKFILPNMATPIKFFLFKHPNYRTTNVQYKLYAVKDVANWVLPGTFAVATDAIEIAATGATTNTAGYLEYPIALVSNYYDATRYFQSGLGLWTEGRMFFEIQSGATSGFVGVEYM